MTKNNAWYTVIATWFGSGYSKIAPGTAGSLLALPFAYLLHTLIGWQALVAASLVFFVLGTWATQQYLKHVAANSDPKEVVIDEVAGQTLALALLAPTLMGYVIGFMLFRLFDVLKPWPIRWFDKNIKGAMGVMLDDMLAGLFAALLPILLLYAIVHYTELGGLVQWMYAVVGAYVP